MQKQCSQMLHAQADDRLAHMRLWRFLGVLILLTDIGICFLLQVRGLESIQHFSENLMHPYQPSDDKKSSKVEELEAENARLRSRVRELEGQQMGHHQ